MKKTVKRAVSFFLLVMMVVSLIPTSALAVTYFEKPKIKSVSIVDSLHSIKENYSYAYRKQIAAANGIEGYRGTAQQNLRMVELLQDGKLIKPAETAAPSAPSTPATKPGCFPAYTGKVTGLVNALNAVGAHYSFAYRAEIALANGIVKDIKDYKGSYKQNEAMINLLVKGDLKKPV